MPHPGGIRWNAGLTSYHCRSESSISLVPPADVDDLPSAPDFNLFTDLDMFLQPGYFDDNGLFGNAFQM